ncbi:uncharacterized protein LOC105166068 [Sesamum indicum]|uniref:Uncharacterized protein LOC105166068 n=1 Tax=Sesamum indicum TaxID=4182 RepID=A0A6I9TES9_SESIN|nr:uncharacterized protein LOC105166068 [Sesamum indicum]
MRESSSIEQSSLLASATEDEISVAQILLDLPGMIGLLDSLAGFQWGRKRRRSSLVEGPSSSGAPSSGSPLFHRTDVEIEERKTQAKAEQDAAAATGSPVSPLHFSPSESDEKPRHSLKKSCKKRSKEQYVDMIEELTQRRDLLRGEIENVTKYYNKLNAYNSQLKALKQEVLNSCIKREDPETETSRLMNLGMQLIQHNQIGVAPQQQQPLVADEMAEKFEHSLGPIRTQFYSGLGPVSCHVGLPDLNSSAEGGALDMSSRNADRRSRCAEARRRRRGIMKIKAMRSACGIKLGGRR